MSSAQHPPRHFAIIGAGMAGITCARTLVQAGHQVTVFEKSSSPSGRMATRSSAFGSFDHGAQYFTARDPLFRTEVERWQAAGVAGRWQPRLAVLGGNAGHDPDALRERFVGVPRMTAPASFLAAALSVNVQTTIVAIAPGTTGWQLASAEQGPLATPFDAVVLAVPAPQAAPLLHQAAPALARLADGVAMRGSWALMLRYATPLALPFDAAFVNAGPLRWIARDNSKPGRGAQETWLLHATAEWSEAHIEDSPEAVAGALLAAFAELGAPPPESWVAHRWRYADSAPPLAIGYAWDAALGLGLCGDWLNAGKVEGAWLSGHALATQMLGAPA